MLSLIAALTLTPVTVSVQTTEPEGTMYVQLCTAETFLTNRCPHQMRREADAQMDFVFEEVEPGDWAVMVWRDVDSDGEMPTGMFGQPLEPTAMSNNPRARFGPPSWEDAKVAIGDAPARVTISIR